MRRFLRLAIVLAAASCRREGGLPIARIDVLDQTAEGVTRPSAADLGRMVHDALDDPILSWNDARSGARVLQAEIALRHADVSGRGVLRAEILLRIVSTEPDVPPIEASGVADKSFVASVPPDARFVREHLARGLHDVGGDLLAQVRLWVGDVRVLIEALEREDQGLRAAAIQAAAGRREKNAVPALIRILRGRDPALSDAAIGALAAIGDRRAVRALCDHASLGDAQAIARVIDAVAALGGEEARAYLDLMGTGHDDPAIRAMARDALVRMDRLRRR